MGNGLFIVLCQVFKKASADAIDLISLLLEYTPTHRLSAVDAMVHSFFDELRDPGCRFPDSRQGTGQMKELPALFNFTRQGRPSTMLRRRNGSNHFAELSICPDKNAILVPHHARSELFSRGIDLDSFVPLSPQEMRAHLD